MTSMEQILLSEIKDLSARIDTLEMKLSGVIADTSAVNVAQFINLPVCNGCTQPEYCRGNAECHYTGSPMINPDGSPRSDFS
jgi:hypothetical protein